MSQSHAPRNLQALGYDQGMQIAARPTDVLLDLTPLAVQLDLLGWFGFAELVVFIAILAVAYVYIWRKGALEWH